MTPKPTGITRFVLRVEQHHGGDRRVPARPSFAARPLSGTASGQPSSGSPVSETASTSRPWRLANARSSGPNTRQLAAARCGRDRSARSAHRASPAMCPPPPAVRPTRAAWRARRPGASGCNRPRASPRPCAGRRPRRTRRAGGFPAEGADRRSPFPSLGSRIASARASSSARRISSIRSVALRASGTAGAGIRLHLSRVSSSCRSQ